MQAEAGAPPMAEPGGMPNMTMAGDPATDLRGARVARIAAALSVLGLVLILLAPILLLVVLGLHIPLIGLSFGTASFTIAILEEILAVITVGALLLFLSFIVYVVSFNILRKSGPGFGAPMGLGVVGILGVLLIFIGILLILVAVVQAVSCASASTDASSCVSLSTVAGGYYSVLGGGFLAFLGWIGLLIGIYRIGKRFDSTITKVGAILYIIPLVNVIAPILVLVGVHGVVRRLEAGAMHGMG